MYDYPFLDPNYISAEEQQLLESGISVQKDLYTSKADFVIESDKFLESSDDDITIRRHTRFVDFPTHRHDYVEIFYCLSGSVVHEINGVSIEIKAGELLFMNQHIEHATKACGKEDLGLNIIIRPTFFQNTLSMINKNNILADFIYNALESESCIGQYLYFTVSDNPCIQNLIHNAVYLLMNRPQNWHRLSESTFSLLFLHILSNAENILLDHTNEQSNVLMVVVRRYLLDRYDTGTLHELADQIGYTQSSLSRMIKKYSGSTFKELQTRQRMRIAMHQLSSTGLPVAEIASCVGYENLNFFYKQFRKTYGVTPNEARLQNKAR
jgi:AraC family transcriptional regulator, L-rhamnose operon regulatory protein RhaS